MHLQQAERRVREGVSICVFNQSRRNFLGCLHRLMQHCLIRTNTASTRTRQYVQCTSLSDGTIPVYHEATTEGLLLLPLPGQRCV